MKLYFVRHADALPGADDALRSLSPRGRQESEKIGRCLAQLGTRFDKAFSSPLLRASSTAELILKACPLARKGKLAMVDFLLNETCQADFKEWLKGLTGVGGVLLVGHEPSISKRVRKLLKIDLPEAFEFPKAGVACVETEDGRRGRLLFFISPSSIA
jgi:phosphohistidine phosphatase